MPLTLSTNMVTEKNRLASDHPWTWLFQVDITGAPAPVRLAMYNEPIVFHGQTFDPTAMQVDSQEDATHAALVNMRATFENVSQTMIALFETYWVTVSTPIWTVLHWQADITQPNEMPFERANVYSVQQATHNDMNASVDLVLEGYSLTTLIPKYRYTETMGYHNIPNRN